MHLKRFARISLHFMLDPVQLLESETGLLVGYNFVLVSRPPSLWLLILNLKWWPIERKQRYVSHVGIYSLIIIKSDVRAPSVTMTIYVCNVYLRFEENQCIG